MREYPFLVLLSVFSPFQSLFFSWKRTPAGHESVPGWFFCRPLFRNALYAIAVFKKKNPSYSQPSASAISLHSFSEKDLAFTYVTGFLLRLSSIS